jgi:hypothetical protein
MRRAFVFIPLAIFLALAVVFFTRIGGDHSVVPSALINKPAPQTRAARARGRECTPALDPRRFQRQRHAREYLGVVVRALPRRSTRCWCGSPKTNAFAL